MKEIAKLLAERKRLDARIKRAVAKAFPTGSRWEFRDTYSRTRRGTVVVQYCRGDTVYVKWENERDNYDAKLPVWGPSSVGKLFDVQPRCLSALTPSAAPSPASAG